MSFLKSFLPAPVVDIFVPIALVLVALYVVKTYLLPPLRSKLEESGAWDQIIARCLADEPDGRFRNVAELLAATHALKT